MPKSIMLPSQQHPGPDIDIDAVIRAAHPAGQQDLRKIGQGRADDADDENRAGSRLVRDASPEPQASIAAAPSRLRAELSWMVRSSRSLWEILKERRVCGDHSAYQTIR